MWLKDIIRLKGQAPLALSNSCGSRQMYMQICPHGSLLPLEIKYTRRNEVGQGNRGEKPL